MADGPKPWALGLALERHRWGGLWLHALAPVGFTGLIFVGGSAPAEPDAFQVNDKVAHAAVFFCLSLCLGPLAGHWLIHFDASGNTRRSAVFCASYALFVGAALEAWQSRLPHRTADLWDWVADAVGAALAAFVLAKLLPHYLRWRSLNHV